MLLLPINDWLTAWNDQWNLGSYEDSARHITELSKMVVDRMLSLTQPADLLLQLLVIALIPAVCEELFFRGALQQILRQWFDNGYVAIAVTALIFSLVHGDVYGLVPRFVLGLLLFFLNMLLIQLAIVKDRNRATCPHCGVELTNKEIFWNKKCGVCGNGRFHKVQTSPPNFFATFGYLLIIFLPIAGFSLIYSFIFGGAYMIFTISVSFL